MSLLTWLTPRRRNSIALRPAAVAGVLGNSPGPAKTVRADDAVDYWRRRAELAEFYANRTEDMETYRWLEAIAREAQACVCRCGDVRPL